MQKTLLDVQSNIKGTYYFLLCSVGIITAFVFEGARAGYYAYSMNITPKVFGILKSSPIPPNLQLPVLIGGSIFLVFFLFLFIQLLFKGLATKVEVVDGQLVQHWNGLLKTKKSFDIRDIQKVKVSKETGYQSVPGMLIKSYRMDAKFKKSNKSAYIFRHADKKVVDALAREIRSFLKKAG